MKIQEIMTRKTRVTQPGALLKDVARQMKDQDIGFLPVCDGQMLIGVVTDRDITVRGTADGLDPATTPVRDVMTKRAVYCFEDEDITAAAVKMEQRQIRRLTILNRDKRLVGVLSLGDLAERCSDENLTMEVLECVCQEAPSAPVS